MAAQDNSLDVKVTTVDKLLSQESPWVDRQSVLNNDDEPITLWGDCKDFLKNLLGIVASEDSPVQTYYRHVHRLYPVVLALVVSAGLVGGICVLSDNGDVSTLKQRLFGSIQLSSGSYPARNVSDLNHVSWENGLLIVEALENANAEVTSYAAILQESEASSRQIQQARREMNNAVHKLDQLLRDRRVILQTAKILKAGTLYAPVYQQSLSELREALAQVRQS